MKPAMLICLLKVNVLYRKQFKLSHNDMIGIVIYTVYM